ncbi:MAG: biotin--[acetyl-CoA-carboxylase] ligase [Methanothrix sp.]|nr:biotin--[acetyl-CoA-carboxylase] ligase [Methanothrix sp.]
MTAHDILSFLISGEWISGEEMAKKLAISRAAVWKQIQVLRQRGYEISASTGKGYRLAKKPDLLDADRIFGCLKTKWLGRDMRISAQVSSTNAVALSLARDCQSGTVILAETQTQGKGRLSRPWVSPPGGIWMSIILKPKMPLTHVYQINMAVAVALCRALSSILGLEAGIKWPNDLLIRELKICGILMEVGAQVDLLDYAVVGLGLNVNNDPSSLPAEWRLTSLAAELGHDIDRCDLIARILEEIEVAYENMGSKEIYEEWRSRSLTLNRQVLITSVAGDKVGEAVDLAEDGALLLRTGDELKRVLAGDCIHLRPLEASCERRDEQKASYEPRA